VTEEAERRNEEERVTSLHVRVERFNRKKRVLRLAYQKGWKHEDEGRDSKKQSEREIRPLSERTVLVMSRPIMKF
jgi:hypothetical protein